MRIQHVQLASLTGPQMIWDLTRYAIEERRFKPRMQASSKLKRQVVSKLADENKTSYSRKNYAILSV